MKKPQPTPTPPTPKQPYETPTITTQEVFEVASLACGKCNTKAPYVQSACLVRKNKS
jgi:hypothetical protein